MISVYELYVYISKCLLLHRSTGVYSVYVSLVHIYKEDEVVPKDGQPVHRGHADDEGKKIYMVHRRVDQVIHIDQVIRIKIGLQ